jgi:transmembrane E3 ubiquitin-protein ligase
VQQYLQPVESGHTWLLLKMKPPASKELINDVAYVKGQLVIYEEQASLAATILPVQGVFLRKLGKLTLFGNSPDSTVQLLYRKNRPSNASASVAPSETPTTVPTPDDENADDEFQPHLRLGNGMTLGAIDGVPLVADRDDYDAVDISPPRYTYVSRFRNSDSFSDQCVSIIHLSLTDPPPNATDPMPLNDGSLKPLASRLSGSLASVNCGLYLKIDTTFQEENLNEFFSKASTYAIFMTFISMTEIYFLLRQLQITNTQATAAKVSLLTIGQQAILDSYLCLGHLTVGIVAQVRVSFFSLFVHVGYIVSHCAHEILSADFQNVFTAFASVAFVKLIIFSVFEMRYLLIIWKARRPQGFADGWLTLRRELTTLYSRFYLSLLGGLAIFYNFSVRFPFCLRGVVLYQLTILCWGKNYLPFLVLVCYSFWVPQIVHNVHRYVDAWMRWGRTLCLSFSSRTVADACWSSREVRNPFDPGYLYGISVLRMLLPLYFYGYPDNFLTAFPMVRGVPSCCWPSSISR